MKASLIVLIVVLIIIVGAVGVGLYYYLENKGPVTSPPQVSSVNLDQSVSDGNITIHYPSAGFGLATNQTQILVTSYIPPCDANFNYCLYYTGTAYQGTNFESAGIRIQHRTDITSQDTCLNQQPSGFSGLTPVVTTGSNYAVSVFSPLSDAAAGNYASGNLYRLFYQNNCYEFETRIGQSQFANYPAGTINEFSASQQNDLQAQLSQILEAITLSSGQKNLF